MIYHQDEHITIHKGEALNILNGLPEGEIDAIIADPPYSSGGLFRSDRTLGNMEKLLRSGETTIIEWSD
jgi:site-specific DNA-methyltransferase (adenine-specific)